MPQNRLHQKMVNTTIANFFAIVLQCYSTILTLELYCNSILKYIYIYIYIYFIPFLSHHLWLSHSLNSVLIVSLSFSLSLSSLLMLFASIGVSWVKWWIGMVGCGLWVLDLGWSGRFSGYFLGWLCGFDVFWVFSGLISVSWPHGSSSDRCVFGIFFCIL